MENRVSDKILIFETPSVRDGLKYYIVRASFFSNTFSPAPINRYMFLLVYAADRILKSTSKKVVLLRTWFWGENKMASIPCILISKQS